MRVYIESRIPSYLTARPARDMIQGAHQAITYDWWEKSRPHHELYVSQLVHDEVSRGDAEAAARRLDAIAGIPLLEFTPTVLDFAESIIGSGLLPEKADGDAMHIAIAAGHGLDVLLTWNCRHIANATIQARLRRLAFEQGFTLPQISTPEGLMEIFK